MDVHGILFVYKSMATIGSNDDEFIYWTLQATKAAFELLGDVSPVRSDLLAKIE